MRKHKIKHEEHIMKLKTQEQERKKRQDARMLIERGCSITLRDRSGRLPHEVVPDALAADFRWLIDLGRQGVARTRVSVSRGPAIGLEAEETLDVS
jgi:hypothetical protein